MFVLRMLLCLKLHNGDKSFIIGLIIGSLTEFKTTNSESIIALSERLNLLDYEPKRISDGIWYSQKINFNNQVGFSAVKSLMSSACKEEKDEEYRQLLILKATTIMLTILTKYCSDTTQLCLWKDVTKILQSSGLFRARNRGHTIA